VPTPPTGATSLKPIDLHGALFMIQQLRKYPGEVTLYVGGPFTTVALALGLDPAIAGLAKELILMGAGFNVGQGGNHRINGRREFNWWWDPEATRVGMSAPWKKITITPVDISVKTTLSDDVKRRIAMSKSPAAQFITKFSPIGQSGGGFMWDEISVLAFLDPTIITSQQQLYVNIDIDHGPGYGQTIFVEAEMPGNPPQPRKMASWWRVATVQWDLNLQKFYDQFVQLMSR
jgi:inosine-uridine nucleoside N-ribohydrolase